MRSFLKLASLGAVAAGFVLIPGTVQARPAAGLLRPVYLQPDSAERHPHMRAALRQLRAARKQLSESAHDYGGHRVAALGQVDQAINEIEQAFAYDAQHEPKTGTAKRTP